MEKKNSIAILGSGILSRPLQLELMTQNVISREGQGFDVMHEVDLGKHLKDSEVIINTIAHTDTKDQNRLFHMPVNFEFVVKLVDYCNEHGKKLVHISTDYVYANSESMASETCIPSCANNMYSLSKLLADEYIESFSEDYLIVRSAHKNTNKRIRQSYINVIGNFQTASEAANQIAKLVLEDKCGIYNIGPREPLSICDFFIKQAKIKNVIPPKKVIYTKKRIPTDTTMSTEKYHNFSDQLKLRTL